MKAKSLPCSATPTPFTTVDHLHVEISMVYLVYSTLLRLANPNSNLSAEISLIYLEHNDGLQNYSFKFHSFCFDLWPLAGFRLWHYTEFISNPTAPDESSPDTRQSRKQTFFPVAALTTVKCDLFETRYTLLRGGRGELRTVLKGNMSDRCQPFLDVFFPSRAQAFPLDLLRSYFRKTHSHKMF